MINNLNAYIPIGFYKIGIIEANFKYLKLQIVENICLENNIEYFRYLNFSSNLEKKQITEIKNLFQAKDFRDLKNKTFFAWVFPKTKIFSFYEISRSQPAGYTELKENEIYFSSIERRIFRDMENNNE